MNFRKINNITGWIVCIIACTVYALTREATASFWDCGEFISSAFKMQVPHPPGTPTFLLLGRLFVIFLGGTAQTAARDVNLLSALASGFTILFLFWTITHFARRTMAGRDEVLSTEKIIAIMGAGVVGALAYTFSDTFWFSAVEGEVYALASLFTALIIWAMLKWEHQADDPHADRWILFIALMIGLSIGVHLLCILTIPAIVMIYYFRRYKVTRWGTLWAFVIGCLITGFVQVFVIQYSVKGAGAFDVMFVNGFGMPFNSGSYFYLALLIVLLILGIRWARKKQHYFVHLGLYSVVFILIGYSVYFTTLIRANASPSINMQDVSDPIALVSYLDRSQYGDFPIVYGPDFTAKPIRYDDGAKVYEKNLKTGKYEVAGRKPVPVYDAGDEHLFPRIWDAGNEQGHADFYRQWLGLAEGQKPTFGDNLSWFFSYQLTWMYTRYFLWNFSGRQNDVQGFGNVRDGNWITGIPFVDNIRLGDQHQMPDSLQHNKAHNKLYGLPFILGIIGLLFHLNRHRRDFLVNLLLFFFTGIAIVIYLNQPGNQPRERDYAYAGSFYAFAIWIGLGVLSVYDFFKKKVSGTLSAAGASVLCLLAVPVIMGFQEWDDHDRSQKTLPRDVASDYLESCAPNAILFTEGDNDTYPLWYAQEVEGVRPDIRIINLSLLGVDWYIDALRHAVNKSAPVPMSWAPDKYVGDKRNYIPLVEAQNIPKDRYFDLNEIMNFMGNDDPKYKVSGGGGEPLNYLPTKNVFIPVDKEKAVRDKVVPPGTDTSQILAQVPFQIPKTLLFKNDLLMLNIIAASHWERPVYFTSPLSPSRIGLGSYLEMDGLTYRLVPMRSAGDNNSLFDAGNVNVSFAYENMMDKFSFGGAQTPGTYFDEPNRRMLMSIRSAYAKLGLALAQEGKKDSALKALNRSDKNILEENFPYALTSPNNSHNITSLTTVYAYYMAGDTVKAGKISDEIMRDCQQQLNYYNALPQSKFSQGLQQDARMANMIISQLQEWKEKLGKTGTVSPELPQVLDSGKKAADSGRAK
ncbi:DUF2723 domain-containing protein [Compostibacter hankyongensis]|uniref:DUF2723 domain-containing protein n=1 Tax=Compostibacter hankyongensis TaxID=1007089 RepID=A0ABP8FPA1_9BACT